MARFGNWAPLSSNWASQSRMAQVDIISIHTMVGSLTGTNNMWLRTGYSGNHSHFGVGGNGECTQWQDTAYRAAANYNGNWHIISVECADVGDPFPTWDLNDGSAVPAFTPQQVETLAQLVAAMCKAHNIPCVLIPDARPGRRGVGYHRLGVPGYMVPGAEQWSTAKGKVCPGDRRIAQIPKIIARAQAILAPPPAPAPVVQAPREAIRMRSVQLTADQPTAVLTVDPVSKSFVMPPGSRAWCQAAAFFPGSEATKARVSWLVFLNGEGKDTKVFSPFNLTHRQGFGGPDFELPPGTDRVEIRVEGIPTGGVVGVHIDGLGHA